MRIWRRLALLFCALSISACSSVQFGYNNAPYLLQYQMDRYLDLDSSQEEILAQDLSALQAWHRQEALPEYATTLRAWAQGLSAQRDFSAADLLEKQEFFQAALLTLGQESAVRLAPLILTLSPAQKDRLRRRFDSVNRDYARENQGSPRKMVSQRRNQFVKQYERWLGSLTGDQLQTLDQWLLSQPSVAELWGQERMARQQALLSLLTQAKETESAQEAAIALRDYFQSLGRYRIDALQVQRKDRQEAVAELTARLLNQMTETQRETLRSKLLGYAQDFETLSRQS